MTSWLPLDPRFPGAHLVWRCCRRPLIGLVKRLPKRAGSWLWEQVVGRILDACFVVPDLSEDELLARMEEAGV